MGRTGKRRAADELPRFSQGSLARQKNEETDRRQQRGKQLSESERRELHQMLAQLSAMQSVPFEAEEPNGSYYEYDRNLKGTVKVTLDGERTPVEKLETSFEPGLGKAPRRIAHEEITT